MAPESSVKYYRDDAALTILGNISEQMSNNTQTLADVSVRLSTMEDSIYVMGSTNSYAAGLVLAGDANHGSEFLRKDGTWQIQTDTTYTAGTGIGLSGSNVFSNTDLGSSQHIFKTIAVSGQDNIVADNNSDTLTIAAGSNVTLTTAAGSDTLTISSTDTNTIYSIMGASSRADGAGQYAAGLVLAGQSNGTRFLKEDGTWAVAAPLASPAFTGTPSLPTGTTAITQAASDNGTKLATTAYVTSAINVLTNAAPDQLDTITELAAALGNDENYAATITAALSAKQPKPSEGAFVDGDKSKLDGIAASANNYTLPIAGTSLSGSIGGIKVGDNLSFDNNSGVVTARRDGFNGRNFMDQFTTQGFGSKQYLLGDGGVIQKWNYNAEGNGHDDRMLMLSDHAVQLFGGQNGAGLFSGNAFFRVRNSAIFTNKVIPNQSDDRYKSRTTDVGDALSLISQVSVRDYLKHSSLRVEEGVEDTDLTGVSHYREVGVVAQELEQISGLEWLVTEHNGIGSELNTTTKFVNYTGLNIYLLRAFQQLNELNTALTARVAALES